MHSYPVPEKVPEGKLYVCRNEAIMTEVQEQDHATLPPSQIQYPVQTCVGDTLFIPLLQIQSSIEHNRYPYLESPRKYKYTFMPYIAGHWL